MRVLLVGTEMAPVLPGRGGVEHLLLGWASELSARHEVTLASVHPEPVVPTESEPFERVWIDAPEQLGASAKDFDLVQLNNRPGWSRFVETDTVVALHNHPYAWHDQHRSETADELRAGLTAARAIVTISRALHDRVAEWASADKATVVYPFADPAFFDAAGAAKEQMVLFPNRLLRKKGVEVVLEVARSAAAAAPGSVAFTFLDFIAPWTTPLPEHLVLRDAIESTPGCTLVPPPPSRRALAALMAGAAVVVVPSLEDEGFGLTSIEAQAAGTRVVVSDRGALRETVPTPAEVVPAGDVTALARGIGVALSRPDPDPARARWVEARFSLKRSAEALERVLLAAAGRRAA